MIAPARSERDTKGSVQTIVYFCVFLSEIGLQRPDFEHYFAEAPTLISRGRQSTQEDTNTMTFSFRNGLKKSKFSLLECPSFPSLWGHWGAWWTVGLLECPCLHCVACSVHYLKHQKQLSVFQSQ